MTQPQLTEEQNAKLEEALVIAQLFAEKLKEMNDLGKAFAQKWEQRVEEKQGIEQNII